MSVRKVFSSRINHPGRLQNRDASIGIFHVLHAPPRQQIDLASIDLFKFRLHPREREQCWMRVWMESDHHIYVTALLEILAENRAKQLEADDLMTLAELADLAHRHCIRCFGQRNNGG